MLRAIEASELGRFTDFWRLLRAYWVSDRWKEAWLLSVAVLVLTTLLSKASVWTVSTRPASICSTSSTTCSACRRSRPAA